MHVPAQSAGDRLQDLPSTIAETDAATLDRAIEGARSRLLAMKDSQGFWVAELETDTTLTSEYLMLRHFLGKVDETKQRKAVAYLRETQLPEGGWNIYYRGPNHPGTPG